MTEQYNTNATAEHPQVLSSLKNPPPLLPDTRSVTVSKSDAFFIPGLTLLEVALALASFASWMRKRNKR